MSLRWQIALAVAGVVAVVSALAAAGGYVSTASQLDSTADDALVAAAREFGAGPGGDGEAIRDGRADLGGCPPSGLLEPAAAAQVVGTDGSITACLPGGANLPSTDARPSGGTVDLTTVSVEGTTLRVATVAFHDGGWLRIARDRTEAEDVLRALRRRLTVLTLLATVIGAFGGWLVAQRIARPIAHLRDATSAISRTQDLQTAIPMGGSGEIRDLADSFTEMVRALATSRDQQRRLVADAGHEMRTPLTSLTTNVELLEAFDRLPEADRPQVLTAVRADVSELAGLTDVLVDLATDRSSDEPEQPTDLADLAEEVAARARRRSARAITVEVEGEGEVLARPRMVERAIANLIDNAVKHTPVEAGNVVVHVTPTSVEVRDHGPGIDPADLDHVFERFYRADEARTRPGSGLGLAIVAQITERHGGRVWARNDPTGGARVGFALATPATTPER